MTAGVVGGVPGGVPGGFGGRRSRRHYRWSPCRSAASSASPRSRSRQRQPIRVGGKVQAANLLVRSGHSYPPLAKAARVQGTVKFEARSPRTAPFRISR